jgi:predicted RNA binding protein YcfA (HicA-like mRNA interferase family)
MADFYCEPVAILRASGCVLVRAGKGSHEIWFITVNGRHVTVPRSTKSRHSANEVLKQAGLPKAFT